MVHGRLGGDSCGGLCGVEPCHEFTVGGSGGVEVLVAFFELESQIDGVLFECDDLVFELVDVVGGAEAGLAPCLLAERFGEALFELLDAGGEASGALLSVEQVGL